MSALLTKRDGPTLRLTLNRPERRNALNAALVSALTAALVDARDDPACRAVVLSGSGTAFSSGADLEELQGLQSATTAENRADARRLARLFEEIVTHPLPILAAANGHAIAGGCGLVAACDFTYAVPHARFGFPEVQIGFVPALVAGLVRRKVGDAAARLLLLTGRLIPAKDARQVGLVTELAPVEDLDAAVRDFARTLARDTSRAAVARTKALLAAQIGLSFHEALADAEAANTLARQTADCKAGVAAFLAGEEPPWTARFSK